jgi:hypothetical protein
MKANKQPAALICFMMRGDGDLYEYSVRAICYECSSNGLGIHHLFIYLVLMRAFSTWLLSVVLAMDSSWWLVGWPATYTITYSAAVSRIETPSWTMQRGREGLNTEYTVLGDLQGGARLFRPA